jgi:hypothetical protein
MQHKISVEISSKIKHNGYFLSSVFLSGLKNLPCKITGALLVCDDHQEVAQYYPYILITI